MNNQIEEIEKDLHKFEFGINKCHLNDFLIDSTINELSHYIAEQGYTKQEWISVEDRLPNQSGKYLVCSNNNRWKQGNVYQARYSTTYGWCQRDKGKGITHWQPLPQPPKMKGE